MKRSVSSSEAIRALLNDDNASWSFEGARALVDYLNECEESCGEIDFCVVDLRCTYSEHKSAVECMEDCFSNWHSVVCIPEDATEGDLERIAEKYLTDNRSVFIRFNGGIIVTND